MNNITFGAKLINHQRIIKYNPNADKYESYNSAFVEIEPHNTHDIRAIAGTEMFWRDEQYACDIAYTAKELNAGMINPQKHKIYALVSPEFNAKKLETKDILAIAEMKLKKDAYPRLERLQVDPELIYNPFFNAKRQFKLVGSGLLDSLKKLYNSILVNSSCTATTFYEKNDFVRVSLSRLEYLWKTKG